MADYLPKPDDLGEPTMTGILAYDRLRVITDAHQFIVPLIWLAVAVVVLLLARTVFAGSIKRMRDLGRRARDRD